MEVELSSCQKVCLRVKPDTDIGENWFAEWRVIDKTNSSTYQLFRFNNSLQVDEWSAVPEKCFDVQFYQYDPNNPLWYWVIVHAGTVYDIGIQSDGKVILVGNFFIGGIRYRVARLHPNGQRDTSFLTNAFNGTVRSVYILPDDQILIGGDFTLPEMFVAKLTADGALVMSFTMMYSFWSPPDGIIHSIDVHQTGPNAGKIVVGGRWRLVDGSYRYIARLDQDGIPDNTFTPNSEINNTVYEVKIDASNRVLVGGEFAWRFVRLLESGSLEPVGGYPLSIDGAVQAITIQPNGGILLGGTFSGIFRVVLSGTELQFDVSFNSPPTSGTIFDIGLQNDGKIVCVGNGTPHSFRLFENGSLDLSYQYDGPPNALLTLHIQEDQKIIVAGSAVARRLIWDGSLDEYEVRNEYVVIKGIEGSFSGPMCDRYAFQLAFLDYQAYKTNQTITVLGFSPIIDVNVLRPDTSVDGLYQITSDEPNEVIEIIDPYPSPTQFEYSHLVSDFNNSIVMVQGEALYIKLVCKPLGCIYRFLEFSNLPANDIQVSIATPSLSDPFEELGTVVLLEDISFTPGHVLIKYTCHPTDDTVNETFTTPRYIKLLVVYSQDILDQNSLQQDDSLLEEIYITVEPAPFSTIQRSAPTIQVEDNGQNVVLDCSSSSNLPNQKRYNEPIIYNQKRSSFFKQKYQ